MKLFNIKSVATLGLACGVLFTSCNKESITEDVAPQSTTRSTNDKNTPAPRVLVNGVPLVFSGAQPVNNAGNVMVPMSAIFQRLGYTVSWNQAAQKVTATKPGITVELWIGNTIAKYNGANVTMSVAPYISNGTTMVHSRFIADASDCLTEWDQETQSVQIYYYDELDYGFYFFDSEVGPEGDWDAAGCQKFVPGQPNRFFDPTKPTIIYVHGNAPGSVVGKSRENFKLNGGGLNVNTQNVWKNPPTGGTGWNVAIFYWIQLADEGFWSSLPPADVEAKIYDHNNANVGMRWRRANGSFEINNVPTTSVRNLFAQKYLEIFNSNYTGAEIRVVGNSLGGNLTMAALLRLHNMGATRMPSRVTLMDPFWTPLSSSTVNIGDGIGRTDWLGGISAETLAQRGIAIEYFRTSLLGASGSSERAAAAAAFTHFGADFLGAFGLNHPAKHTVPVRQYLQSRAQASPREIFRPNPFTAWSLTGNVGASAATANARIRAMMNYGKTGSARKYWNHIDDRSTASMGDDRFEIRDGIW